jgi:hypothetical protein
VLDGRGDLSQIKLRGGAQAFLARLHQVIDQREPAKRANIAEPPPLPVDRSAEFARRAREMLDGRLVACEERFPVDAAHSVLVVVVEREADLWREPLRTVHTQLFGPGKSDPLAPVELEVIDRATADALQRLTEKGLFAPNVRATRHLHPSSGHAGDELSAEEQESVARFREKATRKLKLAQMLKNGEFVEEAGAALGEAILCAAQMLAVEARLPRPEKIADALRPPLAGCWGSASAVLRQFVDDGVINGVLDVLTSTLEKSPRVAR